MLQELSRDHRGRLFVAYLLTASGMAVALLYPLAMGLAINGVLAEANAAIFWLVGCHAVQLALTMVSKRYDTRVFTHIHGSLAAAIVDRSRAAGIEPARVASRVALSREYTVFLEEDVPRMIYAGIALVISLVALVILELTIALACLGLAVPLFLVGRRLATTSVLLNNGLNNRLEHEVRVVSAASSDRVQRHFRALAGWRIKLSDAESTAFGLMELLVIGLFTVALLTVGSAETTPPAGDVFAIFSYLWRFVESLDQVPVLIQKFAKLRDLDRRMATAAAAQG